MRSFIRVTITACLKISKMLLLMVKHVRDPAPRAFIYWAPTAFMGFLVRMDADRLLPSFAAFDRIQAEIQARTEARAGNALQMLSAPGGALGEQRAPANELLPVSGLCFLPWRSILSLIECYHLYTHFRIYSYDLCLVDRWLWPCFVTTKPFENDISMDFARISHRPQQLSLPGLISRFFSRFHYSRKKEKGINH